MATLNEIRTVESLMQTLDDNPSLLEALRTRVLTRELLELPANHAKLTARVDRLTERVDQLTEQVDQLTEQVKLNTQQLAELIQQGKRLQDDVGTIKGFMSDIMVVRLAPSISLKMGLSLQRNLEGPERAALIAGQDLTGISTGDLESFLLADLIMETGNGAGETVYVAVEASYTVDGRDTDRAIRNADYLTRFTGKPARAAVTGRYKDWNIDGLVDSGAVLWYQFPPELLKGL